jgi:hypothetical protein
MLVALEDKINSVEVEEILEIVAQIAGDRSVGT